MKMKCAIIICLLLLPMIGWGAERGDTAGECR